ncbi:dephospho-CoA kinase [Dyadobacter tibetensis]|uniref:dephospho-CoA kinase n=1 Tax=Dyadobacter tibetensis TaxID=1211851 RepID=UPI00046F5C4C|nr:dephospho-CoA kinase [Dyadobacter tibetensis]
MAELPLQIGITGGIGSGKSLVCRIFSCLGIPVYEADSRAIYLANHDASTKNKILGLLGPKAYDSEGLYDRPYVSSQVFGDPERLRALNEIIHPAVRKDTQQWVMQHQMSPYIVKEAAIMNAAGDGNNLDYVVLVTAPESLRTDRVMRRDGRDLEQIKSIMARQATDQQRQAIADYTIINDGHCMLIPQILNLHQKFLGVR